MTVAQIYAVLDNIKFHDWEFNVVRKGDNTFIRVIFKDKYNGSIQKGRKWYISPHMTKSEVVRTAFLAVMTAVEHETREFFIYKGKRVFGPHIDVDILANDANDIDVRREPVGYIA